MNERGVTPVWRVLQLPVVRALLALSVIFAIGVVFHADGTFYKWSTHRDMLRQFSTFGILACGMTVVIITAGIDLSVGSVLGLVAVVFSIQVLHWGWPAWAAIPSCLLLGAVLGAVSGGFIARFAMQPFIVTLAMMVFARGLAKYLSGGQKISNYVERDGEFVLLDIPSIFTQLDRSYFGENVSAVTLVFLACAAVCWVVLARVRAGRYCYAIGGSESAAQLSGVPVGRTKVLAYAMCGLLSAVAGICQAAQEQQGDPEAGATYELTAIAIVVIGGTSLMGGRGSIPLTLIGTLTIGYLDKILSINAVGEASRLMLTGAIIVAAVLLQQSRK